MSSARFLQLFEYVIRDVAKTHLDPRYSETAFVYDSRSETLFLGEHHSAAHRELGLSYVQLARPDIHAALLHGLTKPNRGGPVSVQVLTNIPQLPSPLIVALHETYGADAIIDWPGRHRKATA